MKSIFLTVVLISAFAATAGTAAQDGISMLKHQPSNAYLLGRTSLSESDKTVDDSDNDTFTLPDCTGNTNVPLTGLRLVAPKDKHNGSKNTDALIKKVTVVFENGEAFTIDVKPAKQLLKVVNNKDDGFRIEFAHAGCVRAVSVIGEQYQVGPKGEDAAVNVIGLVD